MKRILQILNLLTLVFTIGINYLANGQQPGKPSISEISARYDTLLTPSGYAFAVWGLIYAGLIVFAIYQLMDIFKDNLNHDFILKIGWWFIIANLANAAWVLTFTNNQIGASLIIMLVIFFSLLKIVLNINMERWDAPVPIIAFIWWPFSLYFGWINVALLANISAWLVSIGWTGAGISPTLWAILILAVTTVIFVTMVWKRNMREYAFAGAWGIVAIAVKNWDHDHLVAWTAIIAAAIMIINASIHGYKNRATAPFARRIKPIQ